MKAFFEYHWGETGGQAGRQPVFSRNEFSERAGIAGKQPLELPLSSRASAELIFSREGGSCQAQL